MSIHFIPLLIFLSFQTTGVVNYIKEKKVFQNPNSTYLFLLHAAMRYAYSESGFKSQLYHGDF